MTHVSRIFPYGRRSIEVLLALLLVFLPIHGATAPQEICFFLALFLFIALVISAAKYGTNISLQVTGLEQWFLLFLFWVSVLVPFSYISKDTSDIIHLLGKVAKPFALYYLALNIMGMNTQRAKKVERLLTPFCFFGFIMSLWAIYQFLDHPVMLVNRASALSKDCHYYGMFLVFSMPLTVSLMQSNEKWKRWFWALTVLLSCGALFVTFKRAAWVAVFVQFILFVFLLKPRWRMKFWLGISILFVSAIVMTLFYPKILQHPLIMHLPECQTFRIKAVGLTLDIVKEHPITGIGYGLGSFHRYCPGEGIVHTHNLFLNTAVEIGVPGLCLLVILLALLFLRLYRSLTREDDYRRKVLISGIFIATTGFVIANLFDYVYHGWPNMLFWLLAGLGMGLSVKTPFPDHQPRP